MKYTLSPDAVLATVLDESMLMLVRDDKNCVEAMRMVNETGVYYWKKLEQGMDTQDIIENAMRDYEISEEIARPSFAEFLEALRDAGYLTLEE